MGEQWGLSVKLFGKTILVVPTSKGDAAQVCSDELLKGSRLSSPVTKCVEKEEEISGRGEYGSGDLKPETGRRSGEQETEGEDPEELRFSQQEENHRNDDEIEKKEAAIPETASTEVEKEKNDDEKKTTTTMTEDEKKPAEKPDKNKILPCPRCKSEDTKFCYYNNYNVNQPRHFCRNCQRYWTAGGTMRNVPVGAGRRKSKAAAAAADANNPFYVFMLRRQQQQQQQQRNCYITAEAAPLHNPLIHTSSKASILNFSPDIPAACDTPVGVVNSPAQTAAAGVVLVYSPTPSASTPTTRTAVGWNQFFSSYITNDQKKGEINYHNQAMLNVSSPTCAPKSDPWMSPPTSPSGLVPMWQQPMHLGKHMRDGENNVKGDVKQRWHEKDDDDGDRTNRNIWFPKALRITDTPDAAASSSIWTTISASGLGFNKKDPNHCGKVPPSTAMERGYFNAFRAKENQVAPKDNRDAVLSANPAALARSHQFQENI